MVAVGEVLDLAYLDKDLMVQVLEVIANMEQAGVRQKQLEHFKMVQIGIYITFHQLVVVEQMPIVPGPQQHLQELIMDILLEEDLADVLI